MNKKITRIIWSDIVRGIFIALGAVAEIYAVALLFDKNITIDFLIIVFCLASAIYYFDFFTEDKKMKKENSGFNVFFIVPIVFIIIFLFLIIVHGNIFSILFAILLLILGLSYDPYFKKLTTKIIGFKDFFVALSWNTMLWLFIIYYNYNLIWGYFLFLIFVFSRDFVNASFCDLKDLKTDKKNKLFTIVELLKERKSIILFQLVNCFSVIMLIFFSYLKLFPIYSLSLIVPIIITSIFILNAYKIKIYSPYFVDVEYFLWPASIILFKIL